MRIPPAFASSSLVIDRLPSPFSFFCFRDHSRVVAAEAFAAAGAVQDARPSAEPDERPSPDYARRFPGHSDQDSEPAVEWRMVLNLQAPGSLLGLSAALVPFPAKRELWIGLLRELRG